jgi:transcription elongation factor Elf1
MQKGHILQFCCQHCQKPIQFSVFDLENNRAHIRCSACGVIYDFSDETLQRQVKKFEDLCRQIQLSEEIFSNTSVGIYLGDKEIKIPYKILLTRLNSTLDLMLGDRPLTITFRIEPNIDTPKLDNYIKNL